MYKYKCNKCGFNCGEHFKFGLFKIELWIREHHLKGSRGCSCCRGFAVVKGINDISTTDPWLSKYIKNDEDCIKHTNNSHAKIQFICERCNKISVKKIHDVYRNQKYSCPHCSDGISMPEKFIISLIAQLNIDFKTQANKSDLKWIKDRSRYDFYIPSKNCIIETHGLQHYDNNIQFKNKTLEELQASDKLKKELALSNGIDHYIVLDCRFSKLDWIKNSIMNSELPKILNFTMSGVNWEECLTFSINNTLVSEVCDMFNNGKSASSILENFNCILSKTTIINYLKKGTKLGWCNYDPKKEKQKSACDNRLRIFRFDCLQCDTKAYANETIKLICGNCNKLMTISKNIKQ